MEIYINSVFDEILSSISKSRKIPVAKMKRDADQLMMRSVDDFIQEGYIDGSIYRDQLNTKLKKRMGIDSTLSVSFISEQKYAKSIQNRAKGSDRIAVIYASGDIVGGRGDENQIAADDMAKTLKSARLDDKIKAVVFRIDSRGGSSQASDIIWREAKLLAEKKPLIVSMGDVAASGGYYIASPAHKIMAEPTTITGSIGVFGLIPNAQELLNDKLGITFDYVGTGNNSDMGRIDRPLTKNQAEYIGGIIDKIYDTFLSRVAEGRAMTKDQVHAIAQGRVWTGKMAKDVGLVDELGGLEDAIKLAAAEADLKNYSIRELPKFKDPITQIVMKFNGESSIESQLNSWAEMSGFEPYITHLNDLNRWGSKHSVQAIMPYQIKIKNYDLR